MCSPTVVHFTFGILSIHSLRIQSDFHHTAYQYTPNVSPKKREKKSETICLLRDCDIFTILIKSEQ